MVPIPQKGDLSICDNWRGISLLDVVGKVFARVMQLRLQIVAEKILPESQCGFRKGRGCTDMVFALRQLVEKLKEADCQAERVRLQRLAEEEQRRREEDLRQIQQSAKDSQAHLHQIIRDWAEAANIERFFQGVYDRASDLPVDARQLVLERLKLARDFIGTQNPLDFFLSWKTPDERYVPLSARSEAGKKQRSDE